jgi:hypothetical protein
VLRVGRSRTVPERQQPSASEKSPGHLVAGFGQSWSFSLKESFEDPVAPEQLITDMNSEGVCIYLMHRMYHRHSVCV